MQNKKITLALIGKGRWGQNYIKTILSSIPDVFLSPKNIKTRNYPELFDNQGIINGVIIATPTSTHFKITKELLEKGFTNLLIEKPITHTLEEAIELEEISKKLVAKLMVGHIQLYDPAYIKLKKHLKDIGKIKAVHYEGLQSPPRSDSTVLQDWGSHPIYLFMDIMEGKPDRVSAENPQDTPDDNIKLVLEYGSIRATANIGWTSSERKRRFEVAGTNGSLVLDGSRPVNKLLLEDKKGTKRIIPFPTTYTPLTNEVLEFVNCIQTAKVPRSPLSQGVEVVKIIKIASDSFERGGSTLNYRK